jgi:hypothetical protein
MVKNSQMIVVVIGEQFAEINELSCVVFVELDAVEAVFELPRASGKTLHAILVLLNRKKQQEAANGHWDGSTDPFSWDDPVC